MFHPVLPQFKFAPSLVALLGALACVTFGAPTAFGAKADPDKLPVTRVRDLHYGDVLFHFYQGENFDALTRLNAFAAWGRIPNHEAEAQLLMGGLYLELGLHNEAGARFEKLLAGKDVPQGVRNRAWFYLGQIWYVRGYLDRAEVAIRRVEGPLPPQLEAERLHLLANVLMRQNRFAEAAQLLDGWRGSDDWTSYARFNLGVALVRDGKLDQAERFLTAVGTAETSRRELLALRDRANLALGFALLQAGEPARSKQALQRVRLSGTYSSRALLGVGWADSQLGDYRAALTPWLELQDRNLLDAAVQESYLAVPYAFARLDANAQAADYYESAVRSFDEETVRIDDAVARIRSGTMLDSILAKEAGGASYGWFWQLRDLPDAPEVRYLYPVLAGHDFQEGLKNYRDLAFLDSTLTRWNDSFDAYGDMLTTRDKAFAERLPRADALLAQNGADALLERRNQAEFRLSEISRTVDIAALGSAEQRDQWARLQQIEDALARAPVTEETDAQRERLRLVKGALTWQLAADFRGQLFQERRSLRALDALLRETQNRWERLARARTSAPANTGEFGQRLAASGARLTTLRERLASAQLRQNQYLADLAIRELGEQKQRLATYQLQARFALATIYDRAASAPVASPAPATAPAPAPGPPPGSAP